MTKRQVGYLKKWALDCQKPDAFKTTNRLAKFAWKPGTEFEVIQKTENVLHESNCCLGRACRLFKLPRKVIDNGGLSIKYDGQGTYLPLVLCIKLGIISDGELTHEGAKLVKTYLKKTEKTSSIDENHIHSLVNLNDLFFSAEETLDKIGKLIYFLAEQEELGIQVFEPYVVKK